jgi:hypothetical protein
MGSTSLVPIRRSTPGRPPAIREESGIVRFAYITGRCVAWSIRFVRFLFALPSLVVRLAVSAVKAVLILTTATVALGTVIVLLVPEPAPPIANGPPPVAQANLSGDAGGRALIGPLLVPQSPPTTIVRTDNFGTATVPGSHGMNRPTWPGPTWQPALPETSPGSPRVDSTPSWAASPTPHYSTPATVRRAPRFVLRF